MKRIICTCLIIFSVFSFFAAAREPDASASIAMKLSEYRIINPGRLEEIIFYDHPSGKIRVMMAMKWKAENLKKKAY